MVDVRVQLAGTLTHDIECVYISHPHVVTFGPNSTDIWEITPDKVQHRSTLTPFIGAPERVGLRRRERGGVNFDHGREIIIIASDGPEKHSLNVYGLRDGQIIRSIEVPGRLDVRSVHYNNGYALAESLGGPEEDTNQNTRIYLYDVAGQGNLIRELSVPLDFVGGSLYATFLPLGLTATQDILAASSDYSEDRMCIFRWRGGRTRRSPSDTVEIGMEYGDQISTTSSILLDNDSFAINTFEFTQGEIQVGDASQSVIRRFDIPSLKEKWYSRPISGEVYSMRYVVSHKAIVAIGEVDEGKDPGSDFDWATTVTVIDAGSGALEHADKINHRKHGCAVRECDVSQVGDTIDVVILFADGTVSVTPLDMFLLDGFEREGDSIKVHRVLSDGFQFSGGAVGQKSAILEGGSEFSLVRW
ncbi:hypothetical protein BDZ94DRAFT_1234745 [Collybia nuda]|uniref:Uncharacterized protein n=1 Tax=Collybia nuda TaxID=64659 RepID=A0A9P5YCU9_9AGAR|nr:hypothetical protein BDZ94DRAFT_1234745 [Collybia nuda]